MNGEIVSVSKTGYHVLVDGEEKFCLINNSFRSTKPPIVNDVVEIEQREDKYFILDVAPRKNFIARFDADTQKHQYFAANIDTAFIVTSANLEFSPARIRRFMSLIEGKRIKCVIVLTKMDTNHPAAYVARMQAGQLGVDCVAINALDPNDVGKLLTYWKPGESAMLMGSSGVGKSTIINTLGNLSIETREAQGDRRLNQGRHTTSARTMYYLQCGRKIIDNPGVKLVASQENV